MNPAQDGLGGSCAWQAGSQRALIEQYESGKDVDLLASDFSVPLKEIWHQLVHLYCGICVSTSDSSAPKHGQYWSPAEDAELDRMYANKQPINEIAVKLGRSLHAVCLRLVLDRRAAVPEDHLLSLGLDPDDY